VIAHNRNHTTGTTAGNKQLGIPETGRRWYCDCGTWEYAETGDSDHGDADAKKSHAAHIASIKPARK
jgi:hypothetical protein